MKPAIVGVEDGLPVYDPDAETLARWTLILHDNTCRECGSPNSDSRCNQGERYEAAARNSNDDIPGYRG